MKNKEEKTKKEENEVKTKIKNPISSLLAFIAFIGIGFIALSLLLTVIFKGNTNVSIVFNTIGQVIAYLICIFLAFFWVNSHKTIPWIVIYVVFVVTIVVLFILNF